MGRPQTTSNLTELMNVGTSVAAYFERAGFTRIDQLAGHDPVEIYDSMCRIDGRHHDPCLLDTIMSAVDQANGNPARPWWTYTSTRKRLQHKLDGRMADLESSNSGEPAGRPAGG
jgi:Pathogenicity locus